MKTRAATQVNGDNAATAPIESRATEVTRARKPMKELGIMVYCYYRY